MRALKHICLMVLLLVAGHSFAQMRNFEKALELYRAKDLDQAKVYIDSASLNSETKKNYNVWMVRAFIYKDLYKTKDSHKATSEYRDVSVESYRKALQFDTTNENPQKEGVLKGLKYIASTYHNDINKTLDTANYQVSLTNANRFVEITKMLDPSFKEQTYFYEVNLTLGSMFEKAYETSGSKGILDLAKVYLFKAHDIDSSSFLVNKNLGLLYYNQAVEIINKMDVDISLEELPIYQDRSVKLGKQALSYCLKAHAVKPDDIVVVEALTGIYYLLNETDKHNEFKKKLEELKRQK